MTECGFLYVLSWISLCPITPISLVFSGFFSIRNQVSNQKCNQVGNQVNQSRDTRPTVADDKRVGLAAPHPAAHKCAIVPFAPIKCFFKNVFAEPQRKFAKQGRKRPETRTATQFFGILLGRCFTQECK